MNIWGYKESVADKADWSGFAEDLHKMAHTHKNPINERRNTEENISWCSRTKYCKQGR